MSASDSAPSTASTMELENAFAWWDTMSMMTIVLLASHALPTAPETVRENACAMQGIPCMESIVLVAPPAKYGSTMAVSLHVVSTRSSTTESVYARRASLSMRMCARGARPATSSSMASVWFALYLQPTMVRNVSATTDFCHLQMGYVRGNVPANKSMTRFFKNVDAHLG